MSFQIGDYLYLHQNIRGYWWDFLIFINSIPGAKLSLMGINTIFHKNSTRMNNEHTGQDYSRNFEHGSPTSPM